VELTTLPLFILSCHRGGVVGARNLSHEWLDGQAPRKTLSELAQLLNYFVLL